MCLTVMTLDNSKHCHLKQIIISLELLRYQGLTVFTPGVGLKKACIDNRHKKKHDLCFK